MSFFDYSDHIKYPINLVECINPMQNKILRDTINTYHSYKDFKHSPNRRINWLIYQTDNGALLGAIGISSCVLAVKCRDDFIGWSKEARIRNCNLIANNHRFCLIPGATDIKNVASMALKCLRIEGAKRWASKYGETLCGIETYVEPIDDGTLKRDGRVYRADNWTQVGTTTGNSIRKAPMKMWKSEDSPRGRLARKDPAAAAKKYGYDESGYNISKSNPKMVFFKPLIKDWRKPLFK